MMNSGSIPHSLAGILEGCLLPNVAGTWASIPGYLVGTWDSILNDLTEAWLWGRGEGINLHGLAGM